MIGCLVLSSCGSFQLPNVEFCGNEPDGSAECEYFVSGEKRHLTPQENHNEFFMKPSVCMSLEGFKKLKKRLVDECDKKRRCDSSSLVEMLNYEEN